MNQTTERPPTQPMRDLRAAQLLFHGDQLALARRWRGLTKRELAQAVGLTPAAVSQYETGHARPRVETLARLALALRLPAEFFARRPAVPRLLEEEWHFRSLRATRKRDRARVLAQMALLASLVQLVEQYVELPQPDIPDHLADELSVDAIERIASELRDLWGLGQGPVSNMVALLEGRGCIVTRIIAGSSALDAFSGRVGLRPFAILTVDKDNSERSRFDAAHELGHLVLHQDVNPGSQSAEKQAHAFASAFLMPRDVIAEELPSRLDFAVYFELKARWRVNVAALLYRARQVGRLSDPGFRRAMTELNANGWRIREPMSGPHERPSVIADALALLERARGLGRDDIARELRVGREDIDQLLEDGPRPLMPPVVNDARARIAATT